LPTWHRRPGGRVALAPLYAKIGVASKGLVQMFGQYDQFASDRFERRLTEDGAARRDASGLRGTQEMVTMKVERLKWSFLFWIGHVGITLGVVAYVTQ
jgi:hypothetical protein